jgi:hypothetical protein
MIHDKAQSRPSFSETDATRLALELYGLTGQANELTSERDQNFHIVADSREQFVLKIAAAAERRETLEFQNSVMDHLGKHVRSGFITNRARRNTVTTFRTVGDENGSSHFCPPVDYHPSALADVNPHSPELLHSSVWPRDG